MNQKILLLFLFNISSSAMQSRTSSSLELQNKAVFQRQQTTKNQQQGLLSGQTPVMMRFMHLINPLTMASLVTAASLIFYNYLNATKYSRVVLDVATYQSYFLLFCNAMTCLNQQCLDTVCAAQFHCDLVPDFTTTLNTTAANLTNTLISNMTNLVTSVNSSVLSNLCESEENCHPAPCCTSGASCYNNVVTTLTEVWSTVSTNELDNQAIIGIFFVMILILLNILMSMNTEIRKFMSSLLWPTMILAEFSAGVLGLIGNYADVPDFLQLFGDKADHNGYTTAAAILLIVTSFFSAVALSANRKHLMHVQDSEL